jgi:site-specific recombinase XerD
VKRAVAKSNAERATTGPLPDWHVNQLRHAAATQIRHEFGLEAAQVILGHAKADVTQVYAERDAALAAEIMRKIG